MARNELGQPIGAPLPDWRPPPPPPRRALSGSYCAVEPLDPERHASALWDAWRLDVEGRGWTYLTVGPFPEPAAHRAWLERAAATADPLFFAITVADQALGVAAYLRIAPEAGSLEVGHIHLSRALARTPAATEAMYLLMQQAFDLGYRRYEWKCDTFNEPSKQAALRLGFTFEGVFRKALVYRQRNRDTAWYSVIDEEWPTLDAAFRRWLDPGNFDAQGAQRQRLAAFRGPAAGGS